MPRTDKQTATDATTDTVTAAEQEATEAEALAAALEERVRDGDDSVTPEQVASQRELGRFARLRVDAARRKVQRQQAEELARQQAAARARVHAEAADDLNSATPIIAALDAFEAATRAFLDAAQAHNERVTGWARTMGRAGIHPSHGMQPDADGLGFDHTKKRVRIDGRTLSHIEGGMLVSAALHAVAQEYPFDFIKAAGNRPPGDPLFESTPLRDVIRRAA